MRRVRRMMCRRKLLRKEIPVLPRNLQVLNVCFILAPCRRIAQLVDVLPDTIPELLSVFDRMDCMTDVDVIEVVLGVCPASFMLDVVDKEEGVFGDPVWLYGR